MAKARQTLQAIVEAHLAPKEKLRLLDAGCGGRQNLDLNYPYHLTCLDISAESLSRYDGADEKVIADIQWCPFKKEYYDLIICWNVLEHVEVPGKVLDRLFSAAAPNGLVVLALPNPLSMKGLLTKFTPHLLHVMVLRYIFGFKNAGRPGYAPYPTYLRFSLAPRRLVGFCEERGMKVIYVYAYEGGQAQAIKRKYPALYVLYRLIGRVGHFLSFGRLEATATDIHVVIGKPGSAHSPEPLRADV